MFALGDIFQKHLEKSAWKTTSESINGNFIGNESLDHYLVFLPDIQFDI